MDILDHDFEPTPPSPERAAARALVLAAVAARALEEPTGDKVSETHESSRQRLLQWFEDAGLGEEAEPQEFELPVTPFGRLDAKAAVHATWRIEGVAVLAWALGRAPLPPLLQQCAHEETFEAVGLMRPLADTALETARLRTEEELDRCSSVYITLHWRLQEFSLRPDRIDFVEFVRQCQWAEMCLDGLEIIDNDLAIDGVPIDRVQQSRLRELLGIVQERRLALEWLSGFEPLYSDVTADT